MDNTNIYLPKAQSTKQIVKTHHRITVRMTIYLYIILIHSITHHSGRKSQSKIAHVNMPQFSKSHNAILEWRGVQSCFFCAPNLSISFVHRPSGLLIGRNHQGSFASLLNMYAVNKFLFKSSNRCFSHIRKEQVTFDIFAIAGNIKRLVSKHKTGKTCCTELVASH